ncbi:MAG: alpha/beta fold hydrolase, partial [Nitratireductor sp.]
MPLLDNPIAAIAFIAAALILLSLIAYWGAQLMRRRLDDAARRKLLAEGKAQRFVWLPDGIAHASYYRAQGTGSANTPVVVLIHGFSTPSFVWRDHIEPLTQAGFRVLTYDHFGRGFSARPRREYDAALLDRQLDTLLDAFDLKEPVHLVGYSMGGAVAMNLAASPDAPKIDGLILAAPAVWGWHSMNLLYRSALWTAAHVAPDQRLTGQGLGIMPSDNIEMLRDLGRDPLVIKETRIATVYGLVGLMDGAYEAAPKISVPVLYLYGAKDQLVPR